ncbi:MAG: hypothetical protein BIP78_0173 [Candidatus Bipolaricaulis sibiricus]|uniref:DUF4276 family protein n=1 Tax=Bipolaricaulis sibiricus TaxID=2501609 RepID=A0A410FSJ6_BIPS1|nr:MAG: hypothetical protein BIP78_0173 [Candidatus Bipolaricaulis sibiricus]
MTAVSIAVEGSVDRAVAERLIRGVGGQPGTVYGEKGKEYLRSKITAWNKAAQRAPWLVLVDLNTQEPCAPRLVSAWLPRRAPFLCFRVAVREVEAWLLADRAGIARFLGVSERVVPADPETLRDPKATVVDLARRSRKRLIREDLVPDPRSGRREGRAYASRLASFARDHWQPRVAEGRSPSLAGAIACLRAVLAASAPGSRGIGGLFDGTD